MKKRMTAILTLAIFLVGVFGSSVTALATQTTPIKGVTVTDMPIKNPKGTVVDIPDMMDLQLTAPGVSNSRIAYCFNANKTMPNATGSTGYTLAGDQSESGYNALATNPRNELDTLRNHVRNVIWNGYPYFGGNWKGVNGDPAGYVLKYGMTDKMRLTALYNMQVTQQAIWFYTDTKVTTGPLVEDITKLVAAAKLNPAPANFKLDLYNGDVPKTQHVLALVNPISDGKKMISIKVENKWLDEDETSDYAGKKPNVSYEIYAGNKATQDQLLGTYAAGSDGKANIPLIDDDGTYTIREVIAKDDGNFVVRQNDQVVDLRKELAPVIFTNVFTGNALHSTSVPVGVEVTLDGKRPDDATFSVLLKDSAGNIVETKNNVGKVVTFESLSFDKEGTYTYTVNELAGDNKNIKYDSASYELTVTVTRDLTPVGKTPFLKAKTSWKKNGTTYDGLVPVFENTTVNADTTTLTVNKVWKNDKTSSRPKYVNVQLYRNGTAYGELVRLDASNNWTYTWKELDASYKWTVNEPNVPTGYVKTSKTNGNTWTITNTAKSSSVTTPGTTKPTTTKPNVTKPSTNRSDRSTPQTDDTSHLNWWVTGAGISLAGMCLIGLLWVFSRRKQHGKK